jgi:hypothetical protein
VSNDVLGETARFVHSGMAAASRRR